MTSALFSPFRFRNGVTARNRVWLAPLTNLQSHEDGSLSDDELRWLARRAAGGFGVIETCAAYVSADGKAWDGELGVHSDAMLPGLTRLAGELRRHGARGIMQIFHGGLRAIPSVTGLPAWSASASEEGGHPARSATEDDIAGAIRSFRDAAVRAHEAGFAGVELHGAHGYLFGQFLSRTENRREDRWGGSLENRARMLREAMRAARAAVPASFIVGLRLSPEDYGNAKGLDLDESLTIARWAADDGADYLHLSLWVASKNTTKQPESHAISLFREAVPHDLPIVVAGHVWTRAEAEALIEKGAAGVALGRAGIVNPDWPRAIADASWEPRRPPLTRAELEERALSPRFVTYLTRWKNFVAD